MLCTVCAPDTPAMQRENTFYRRLTGLLFNKTPLTVFIEKKQIHIISGLFSINMYLLNKHISFQ